MTKSGEHKMFGSQVIVQKTSCWQRLSNVILTMTYDLLTPKSIELFPSHIGITWPSLWSILMICHRNCLLWMKCHHVQYSHCYTCICNLNCNEYNSPLLSVTMVTVCHILRLYLNIYTYTVFLTWTLTYHCHQLPWKQFVELKGH